MRHRWCLRGWAHRAVYPCCTCAGLPHQLAPCACAVSPLLLSLQVVAQLWVAVVGALLLFVAVSWLFGYLAAQGAYAECDLQAALAGEDPPAGDGSL